MLTLFRTMIAILAALACVIIAQGQPQDAVPVALACVVGSIINLAHAIAVDANRRLAEVDHE